ncbi:MAG TPA: methionine--tRNA ligase [Candidatus Dormibacteraeota bacterium]|nr:methionine--tRNA ligase [Candidatus Dormibacteraeota bacterium]
MSSSRPGAEHVLVAVAWPYASGPRHIGHVAGFGVPSDIFARYQRLRGARVLMVSGTDEHGTPILVAADREGVSPREIADRYNSVIVEDLQRLGLSYDLFTRTTTRNHAEVAQDIFLTLFEKGYLLRQTQQGAFSAATGRALPDRYIEGTCPHCGYAGARGDQCDNCGQMLDPADLIEPRSRIDGEAPAFRESEHFMLDLPAFAGALTDWLEAKTGWRSNVRSFSLNAIAELRPRAVTRDIDWGIRIPLPEFADRDDKLLYVWFEAVIGYLSAAIEWALARGEPEAWRAWWQNPEASHFYFMGKDNIIFHTVIWPSILMGYGSGGKFGGGPPNLPLVLPDNVVSSEFLTMEGQKFSNSRGIAIEVRDFLERYDPDPLRYYLTAAGPETQDTDFTWAEFIRRNNDELVATWGNLVNRTLTIAKKHFGEVPQAGALSTSDEELIGAVEKGFDSVGALLAAARFKAALAEVMALAARVNQYLTENEPWRLVSTDRERAATVLYVALRCIDNLKVQLLPFLPFSSQRLHQMLGFSGVIAPLPEKVTAQPDDDPHLVLTGDYLTPEARWEPSRLTPGQALGEPAPLFRKLEPEQAEAELAKMAASS